MEQKKLLLVAISVGVFLVIVIGAGILVFGPQAQAAGTTSIPPDNSISYGVPANPSQQPVVYTDTPATMDAPGLIQNGVPGLQTPPQSVTAPVNTVQVNTQNETPAPKNPVVTVTIEPKPAAGVPTAAPQGRAAPSTQTQPKTTTTNTTKPAVSTTTTTTTTTNTTPPKTTTTTTPKPPAAPVATVRPVSATIAPAVNTYNDYWVQAGSFTAKVRAENVKETLASKGITSIIENRDVNGATYFRVRIGPYTSQNEADYWLSLIKSINGFEESQIWQSSSVR
jgi:DedD protein